MSNIRPFLYKVGLCSSGRRLGGRSRGGRTDPPRTLSPVVGDDSGEEEWEVEAFIRRESLCSFMPMICSTLSR